MGGSISVLPKDLVGEQSYTGQTERLGGFAIDIPLIEAPVAQVQLKLGAKTVTRDVAVLSGETLGWEGVFASNLGNQRERDLLLELSDARRELSDDEARYLPSRLFKRGKV